MTKSRRFKLPAIGLNPNMPHMSKTAPSAAGAVSLFDTRPFFEKALSFGVQHNLLDLPKLDAIAEEAPRGMVQIARYFGNEFLRPDLELARQRLVNLVSLHLEHASGGDLQAAAELLRDHSFLSRSKAGSEMLKALLVMPRDTHFYLNDDIEERQLNKLLADWSLKSYAQYQAELAVREPAQKVVDAALWLAEQMDMSAHSLHSCERHAEAVIRTALMALSDNAKVLPDRVVFEKMIANWRNKVPTAVAKRLALPGDLPEEYRAVVEDIRQSVLADLPQLLDKSKPVKAFFRSLRFKERYFWIEDLQSEMLHHESEQSATWRKVTQGAVDDERTLLTLFLGIAAGRRNAKTVLTEKSAAALIRTLRNSGFQPELTTAYIKQHAPHKFHDSYLFLWSGFVDEVRATLLSDHDYKLTDALALLRHECNVA